MIMVLTKLFMVVASAIYVSANMAPNYPEPGTIWKAGKEYEISWCKYFTRKKLNDCFFLTNFLVS
jgi:hypothetical protein